MAAFCPFVYIVFHRPPVVRSSFMNTAFARSTMQLLIFLRQFHCNLKLFIHFNSLLEASAVSEDTCFPLLFDSHETMAPPFSFIIGLFQVNGRAANKDPTPVCDGVRVPGQVCDD